MKEQHCTCVHIVSSGAERVRGGGGKCMNVVNIAHGPDHAPADRCKPIDTGPVAVLRG